MFWFVLSSFAFITIFSSHVVFADDDAAIDPEHKEVTPVNEGFSWGFSWDHDFFHWDVTNSSSDLKALIQRQTPVKAQGRRGTCSIFSATGHLESVLKILHGKELDLSENYLQFLVMSRIKHDAEEGSDTHWNASAFQQYGTIYEDDWPYEPIDWAATGLSDEESGKMKKICGGLSGRKKKICLLAHRDPTNDPDEAKATKFYDDFETWRLRYRSLVYANEIKALLRKNYPLVLSLEFYYGAWNHSLMENHGIGKRNLELWAKGVVSTPTADDIRISRQHEAGHSIVVVGFDDVKKVYYFKNSWGVGGFGTKSNLISESSTSGYGSITYGYAHRFGTFYDVFLADDHGMPMRGE